MSRLSLVVVQGTMCGRGDAAVSKPTVQPITQNHSTSDHTEYKVLIINYCHWLMDLLYFYYVKLYLPNKCNYNSLPRHTDNSLIISCWLWIRITKDHIKITDLHQQGSSKEHCDVHTMMKSPTTRFSEGSLTAKWCVTVRLLVWRPKKTTVTETFSNHMSHKFTLQQYFLQLSYEYYFLKYG